MTKIILPKKIVDEYEKCGILSLSEIHGMKENWLVFENIIEQLPTKPNLAVEFGYFDKIEFENFLLGKEINLKNIYYFNTEKNEYQGDGRVTLESFTFLKNYIKKYPDKKIIFLDEKNTEYQKRDLQQANHFLENFEKPFLIISGNLHSSKEIKEYLGKIYTPMGYYVKEKFGDFPFIDIQPASGSYLNREIINIRPDPIENIEEFIDIGENNYKYYIKEVTPATLFK
jgi:hypothetical protein